MGSAGEDPRASRAAETSGGEPARPVNDPRLALLLAMAMFVLVVDTSLMNVSISAVVEDLETTVSGVQAAIALEALVSAAFILIGSKVGDLIGRKRAFVLGLLGYAIGATSMAFAQGLTSIIIFWAIIGGLGASLLLPAMQSLIHGNFEGPLSGRSTRWSAPPRRSPPPSGRCWAASSPPTCRGGSGSSSRSWSSPSCCWTSGWFATCRTPATGASTWAARSCPSSAWVASCWASSSWQEGGESVVALIAVGALAMGGIGLVAGAPQAAWQADADRPRPVPIQDLPARRHRADAPERSPWAAAMIALPIFLQMVLEYNAMLTGLAIAPLSLTMFACGAARRQEGGYAATEQHHPGRIRAPDRRDGGTGPGRAPGGFRLVPVIPLIIAGAGLGLLVSQLNNYTLAPDLRGTGQRGRRGELGGRVVRSVVRAGRGRSHHARGALVHLHQHGRVSTVLPPAEQQQVADALENDAELMTNTDLEEMLAGQPPAIQEEIIRINTEARPKALQVALLVPFLAGLIGLINSFRMMREPDPAPSGSAEGTVLG